MKLIVSTFLVYKVKKCLLKSGKVSSSDGPSMPFGWSACARYTGIRSPPSGHRQPLCWATTAHNAGNECPNIGLIFGQYSFDSFRYLACPRRPKRVYHGLMTHPLFIFTQLLDDFLKLLNIQKKHPVSSNPYLPSYCHNIPHSYLPWHARYWWQHRRVRSFCYPA